MAVLPILRWPHAVLRAPAAPVGAVTETVRAVWDDMVDTMEAMPGYGLAAPQIGVGQALAVVDCSVERAFSVRMADPVLVWASDEMFAHVEASPNLPGAKAGLVRPRRVRVAFLNAAGLPEEREFSDLWATSVQHQMDHLAGRMFFDRLSPLKRRMLLARAEKLRR